jgi:hypothetical protein
MPEVEITSAREAIESWQAWAKGVLESHKFDTPRQRRIWGLYADGKTYREISIAARVSRSCVARVILTVKSQMAPGNPWRKDPHADPIPGAADPRITTRLLELATSLVDLEAFRHLVASDETLANLNGGSMPAAPKTATYTYSLIRFRKGTSVNIPGIQLEKERLSNVEGRPHVGGIDVSYDGKDTHGHQVKPPGLKTVPWWKIEEADRAVEVEE